MSFFDWTLPEAERRLKKLGYLPFGNVYGIRNMNYGWEVVLETKDNIVTPEYIQGIWQDNSSGKYLFTMKNVLPEPLEIFRGSKDLDTYYLMQLDGKKKLNNKEVEELGVASDIEPYAQVLVNLIPSMPVEEEEEESTQQQQAVSMIPELPEMPESATQYIPLAWVEKWDHATQKERQMYALMGFVGFMVVKKLIF